MPIWLALRQWAFKHFNRLTGRNLLILFGSYVILSWLALWLANEHDLTASFTDFLYYLVVTASTVGYGDMSPSTALGKWCSLLFIIPAGLGLFAIIVGHIASMMVDYWRRGITGKRGINVTDHIVILGWNGQRTLQLIRMLQHDVKSKQTIVLCVRPEMENPLPGEIDFIRTETFTDQQSMQRACLNKASTILIDNPEDDITLSSALYCAGMNPNAHILAYFNDETLSELLKQHCPNVECIPSVSVEMMAKAAVDPGSSRLHHELLATNKGMTQYAVTYPSGTTATNVSVLFERFKHTFNATLIGLADTEGRITLNPSLDTEVYSGMTLFYIADERVSDFHW
ncbi:potassium channel family protein [Thaumasiovibrio sp. DFM-14]|uniref:potassium channel protein n=1 Tax=Thaumasiovibrio sp. DFM-14 TaxID=3384792 RepID=UPI00399F53A4